MKTGHTVSLLAALIGMSLSACAPKGNTQNPAQAQTQADSTPAASPAEGESAQAPEPSQAQEAPAQPEAIAASAPPPVAAQLSSGATCPNGAKAGDSWKVDCNTCSCSENGELQCTLMACEAPDAKEETSRCPEGKKVGDTWNDECNMCRCDEAGYPVCTLRACLD